MVGCRSIVGAGLAAWLAALGPVGSGAQPLEMNIMGGPGTGDFNTFARDISEMAERCGLALNVVESEGGLDNFLAVRKRPFTQLGLSRDDVLEFMDTYARDDPAIAEARAGVRMVMPLHDEEVHLFAPREVETLEDLDGKRVAIGPPGSGTFMTASLILDLAGVEPAERVATDFAEMVPALFSGAVDAAFGVFAAPVRFPGQSRIDPERWHFVPIREPIVREVYEPATIPAGTYPFQPEPVETVSTRAVLLTFEYDPRWSDYHRDSCRAVADVAHLMVTRIDELRALGHPKWQSVELGAEQPGWEVSACARMGMREDYELRYDPTSARPVDDIGAAYRSRICRRMGIDC